MKRNSSVIKVFFYLIIFAVFFNACYAGGQIVTSILLHSRNHGAIADIPDDVMRVMSEFIGPHFILTHSQITDLKEHRVLPPDFRFPSFEKFQRAIFSADKFDRITRMQKLPINMVVIQEPIRHTLHLLGYWHCTGKTGVDGIVPVPHLDADRQMAKTHLFSTRRRQKELDTGLDTGIVSNGNSNAMFFPISKTEHRCLLTEFWMYSVGDTKTEKLAGQLYDPSILATNGKPNFLSSLTLNQVNRNGEFIKSPNAHVVSLSEAQDSFGMIHTNKDDITKEFMASPAGDSAENPALKLVLIHRERMAPGGAMTRNEDGTLIIRRHVKACGFPAIPRPDTLNLFEKIAAKFKLPK